MCNSIKKFERSSYPRLFGNLYFENFEKIDSKSFLEKEFANKMSIFLQFRRPFLGQSYFFVIVIHVQLSWF